ncbi:MAG: chromate transporter [Rikenellaceae bacterium]
MNISLKLMLTFAKIGSFTFGGGYAMVGMIQKEIVDRQGWIEKSEFLELLTLAQTAPGPIALNTSVFVGYKVNGYKGAVASVFGSVMPSFIIILIVALCFANMRENPIVEAVLKGIRPAVIALILAPSITLCKGLGKVQTITAIISAVALCYFKFSPIWLILVGAAIGVLYFKVLHRNMAKSKNENDA